MATMVGMYVEFKAKSQEIDQTFKKVQGEIDKLKSKQADITGGFNSMTGKVKDLGLSILNYGKWVALSITAASAGIWIMLNKTAEAIDKVTDSARGLGVGAKELQSLAYAADLSGVSFESLETLIKKMGMSLGDAVNGSSSAKSAFNELGLSLDNLKSLSVPEQMDAIVTALGQVDDKTKQNSLAFAVFGKSMTDALSLARDGFSQNLGEFDKLGLALTDTQRTAVDAFGDSQNRLSAIWQGFAQKITAYVAEPFSKMIDWISDTILKMGGIDSAAQKFAKAIVSGVQVAVSAVSGLLDIIDGIYARMLKIQIFAKETALNAPDPFFLGTAVLEKVGVYPEGAQAQRDWDRAQELPKLYKQLNTVEKASADRKNFLKPLSDLLDQESAKIGTAMESYIGPVNMATKAAKGFATATEEAAKKISTSIETMIQGAGQDKLKTALGLDKQSGGNEVLDGLIKDIYTKSVLGTGGYSSSGMFNGKQVGVKTTTASEDLKTLEEKARSMFTGREDTGDLGSYLGAISELKQFISKIDPASNRVKLDIEVKTEEGYLLKITESAQLKSAIKTGMEAVVSSAARMGAK